MSKKKINTDVEALFLKIVNKIYKEGISTQNIVQWLMTPGVVSEEGLGLSRSYELIRESKLHLSEYINETRADSLNESLSIMESIRQKAMESGNLKEARECQKEISKLEKLYVEKQEAMANNITINYNRPNDN